MFTRTELHQPMKRELK